VDDGVAVLVAVALHVLLLGFGGLLRCGGGLRRDLAPSRGSVMAASVVVVPRLPEVVPGRLEAELRGVGAEPSGANRSPDSHPRVRPGVPEIDRAGLLVSAGAGDRDSALGTDSSPLDAVPPAVVVERGASVGPVAGSEQGLLLGPRAIPAREQQVE